MQSPALSPLTVAAPAATAKPVHPARGTTAQPGAFASELQQAVDLGGDAARATPGDKSDGGTDGSPAPCVGPRADTGSDPAARSSAAARLRLLARATAAHGGKAADTDVDGTGADPAKAGSADKTDKVDKTLAQTELPLTTTPAPPQPPVTDTPPPAATGAGAEMTAAWATGAAAAARPTAADSPAAPDGPAPARNDADGNRPGLKAVAGSDRNPADALRDAAARTDANPARTETRSDTALETLSKATARDDGTPVRAGDAGTPALPSFAGELARATQTLSGPAPTREPTALALPTPVLSPEFVPRFSAEVAVLARDGIQEARVQVHPVELGPIAVQISVDGTAAQVQLVVENSQTHQLLEQSMPALAAALRENGLTLTGGGVFQQAGQGGGNGQGGGSSTPGGARGRDGDERDAAGPVAAPVRRARLPGALDLYA